MYSTYKAKELSIQYEFGSKNLAIEKMVRHNGGGGNGGGSGGGGGGGGNGGGSGGGGGAN